MEEQELDFETLFEPEIEEDANSQEYKQDIELKIKNNPTIKSKKLFTYFGNKAYIAEKIWEYFGKTEAYVEPFAGCASVLLASPFSHTFEAINDADCYIVNAFRSVKYKHKKVIEYLFWPRTEIDLHSRHDYLVAHRPAISKELLRGDPKFCDPELAAWWMWGINLWLGSGWCGDSVITKGKNILTSSQKPVASKKGVLTKSTKPVASKKGVFNKGVRKEIIEYMVTDVFNRLIDVNILYGDFERLLTPSYTTGFGSCAVLLDPPYKDDSTNKGIYAENIPVWDRAKDWFLKNRNNKDLHIILCGNKKDWKDYPQDVRSVEWKRTSGYSKDKTKEKRTECLWLSKGCCNV